MEHLFCPECGFKNELKNKFCPSCGSKLNTNTEELFNSSNDKEEDTSIENISITEDVYVGEEKNGVPHGKGKMVYANGDVYEGEWFDGKKNGQGISYYLLLGELFKSYEGTWKEDKKEGFGISYYYFPNTKEYEGNWKNDNKHGYGIFYETLNANFTDV
jgi:hypothetical protein